MQALLQLIEKRKEMKKKPLLEEEHAVNLQFATFKVPRIQTTVKLYVKIFPHLFFHAVCVTFKHLSM